MLMTLDQVLVAESNDETSSSSCESKKSTVLTRFDIQWFVEHELIGSMKKISVDHNKLDQLSFKIVKGKLTQELRMSTNNMGLVIQRGVNIEENVYKKQVCLNSLFSFNI